MNTKSLLAAALALTAAIFLPAISHAQKTDTKNITCNALIQEVDTKGKAITVKIKDGDAAGKQRTIEIAGNTKIQRDGKINQKLKDLATGDEVNLTYKKVKEPTADRKSMVEVYKAVQIIVTTTAAAPAAGAK
jgi:hypothetical protein